MNVRSMVFWMGDLNYRLIGDDGEIKELIGKKRWPQLWEMDEVCGGRVLGFTQSSSWYAD